MVPDDSPCCGTEPACELSVDGTVHPGTRPGRADTVQDVSSPRTDTIRVQPGLSTASVRERLRAVPSGVGVAVVRTPELTIGALGVLGFLSVAIK